MARKKQRRSFGRVFRDGSRRSWYVTFHRDGKRLKWAAGKTRKDAETKLLQVEALFRAGVPLKAVLSAVFEGFDGHRLRFRDAIDPYLRHSATRTKASTYDRDRARLHGIAKRAPWSGKYLGQITSGDLSSWIDSEAERGLKPATRNRLLSGVSAVLEWAKGNGYIKTNPARDVTRASESGNRRRLYATAAEAEALIQAADTAFQPYLIAALYSGARAGELASVQWRHVDLERGFVALVDTKTGDPRDVPLTGRMRELLTELRGRRAMPAFDGRDPVFTLEGLRKTQTHERRKHWLEARKRAKGLRAEVRSSLRWHDLRHSCASLMIANGVPLAVVGQVLGHKSANTTRRYAHLLPEAAQAAAAALDEALGAARAS